MGMSVGKPCTREPAGIEQDHDQQFTPSLESVLTVEANLFLGLIPHPQRLQGECAASEVVH